MTANGEGCVSKEQPSFASLPIVHSAEIIPEKVPVSALVRACQIPSGAPHCRKLLLPIHDRNFSPTIKLDQAVGFNRWALKAVLNGRGNEK